MSDTLSRAITPDMMRRIAITLAALLLIDVMARIPLPGVNLAGLYQQIGLRGHLAGPLGEQAAWARLSIGALNITPIFAAFFVFEIWRTITGKTYGGDLAVPHAARVLRWVIGAALVLAAIQAWGIATALEQIRPNASGRLVATPGLEFRLSTVASMIGATAVTAWLMTIISRDGCGGGLWILFAAAALHQLPAGAAQAYQLASTGAISPATVWLSTAAAVAATAPLIALSRARDEDGKSYDLDPWPPMIGHVLFYAWMFGMRFLWGDDAAGFTQAFTQFAPGSWGYVIGFPFFVAVVAVLRAVRFNARAGNTLPLARLAPPIVAVVGICIGAALLSIASQGLFSANYTLIPVVMAALAAIRGLTVQGSATAQ